ncbi:hypothetical protein PsorP6_000864 [Peronosclerospora sorghi]|uniref:Uncharacterized protein n=1 Tax=Peronosclerospora sorghi TaxID=230839 RepID=A0ACC0WUF1_9STRA|nr:hypothetical protein PsorP6_000864 [Peronosclerospora sorghi]
MSARMLKRTTGTPPRWSARHVSYLLGIETSCDDTAAAVLDQDGRVLSNVLSSQWELHAKWKGIVPALAARAHAENLPRVMHAAIAQRKELMDASGLTSVKDLSAVAVTSGPGLAPCLDVGLQTARQMCLDHRHLAFLQIHHLELDTRRPEFPFLVLLVSGGHCCLVLATSLGTYELLGKTVDDSIGEAYDKVARMLHLTSSGNISVHSGKLIEQLAARGNDRAFPFTEPMKHRKVKPTRFSCNTELSGCICAQDCNFSYSGIKTAMLREVTKVLVAMGTEETDIIPLGTLDERTKEDLCASFQRLNRYCINQRVAVNQLITRTRRACRWSKERVGSNISTLVVCGGVASNQYLRDRIRAAVQGEGVVAVFPPPQYCTDNGVMVAWAGLERYAQGMRSDPASARYQPRWPLEQML